MPREVFISYNHSQGEWVWNRLAPCLDAGGARVLIDRDRFEAGKELVAQMDAIQDAADLSILVLSPEYLRSDYCVHEMKRALRRDPRFEERSVVPVLRHRCDVPDQIKRILYVDLCKDQKAKQWAPLLKACGADLGIAAPDWLAARDDILRSIGRNESVNLLVRGRAVAWRPLIKLLADAFPDLAQLDLHNPATASRRGLVEEILHACGVVKKVPKEPEDLVELGRFLIGRDLTRLALLHFDPAAGRGSYGFDLFAALRYHLMESRKLVLLIQSSQMFAELIPRDNPLSHIPMVTVELRGKA